MEIEVDQKGDDQYEVVLAGIKHTLNEAEVKRLNSLTKVKRNYTRLSRKDWDELDRLLDLHGWGGYYDLVECIKGDLSALGAAYCEEPGSMVDIHESVNTLPEAVDLLSSWATVVGRWRIDTREDNAWAEEVRTHYIKVKEARAKK